MIEQQPLTVIDKSELVAKADELVKAGHRLIYICCTPGDPLEITYSFDKAYSFSSLRIHVAREGATIPSISGVCAPAFTYENEIQDLFGVKVTGMSIDFQGNFYKLAQKTPWANAGVTAATTPPQTAA